jgi:hypothetical protein
MAILGSIVLAIGALFGIWLGAYYATIRLRLQLEEQAQWFSQRLDENRQLLDRQLRHDRQMRDRDELRQVLDEAIDTMQTAVLGLFEILTTLSIYTLVNPYVHRLAAAGKTSIDPRDAVLAAVYGMGAQHRRLRLRAPDALLNGQYWSVREKLILLLGHPALEVDQLSSEEKDELKKKYSELGKETDKFVRMAAEYLAMEAPEQRGD